MADRAVYQLQPRLDRALSDVLDLVRVAEPFDVRIRAEFQIDPVGIVDQLLRQSLADQGGKIAADFIAERELSVGKRARAGESGRDVAVRLAVHAFFRLCLGAEAALDRLSLLHDDDMFFRLAAQKLERGEDTGRTGADDDDICVHE